MKKKIEQAQEALANFTEAARPLIKYLNDNHHPHVTAIITSTSAELLEGMMSNPAIHDYVKD